MDVFSRQEPWFRSAIDITVLIGAVVLVQAPSAAGYQDGTDAASPPAAASEDEDPSDEELDELSALLELADEDPARLAEVQVARTEAGNSPVLDTVVSTVERKESTIGRTPAAVFVITPEMIRRSGARTVPEALRLAPGVQVARIDANKWAVSIRGFNNRFANKLLVQIDGRSVYNPLFGGVFWDAQQVLLEDVERIEVVRGPGGTVWGENAVNGVINIITKPAHETEGVFAEAGGGNLHSGSAAFRAGSSVSPSTSARVFGQWNEHRAFGTPIPYDDLRNGSVGIRVDTDAGAEDQFMFSAGYYEGSSGTLSLFAAPTAPFAALSPYTEQISGTHVLARWTHTTDDESDWQLQAFYDRTRRSFDPVGSHYTRHTFDVDFQQRFSRADNHEFIWGAGFRTYQDLLRTQPFFLSASPSRLQYDVVSAFAQDSITLTDSLSLILGTKLSHNDFTGGEIQPSARMLWLPDDRTSTWMAVSRAVRTATRLTHDSRVIRPGGPAGPFPIVYPAIVGRRSIEAEDVLSLEWGFRRQQTEAFSWDLAAFWNRYEDLVGLGAPAGFGAAPEGPIAIVPFANSGHGETYGAELAANYDVSRDWQLRGTWSLLKMNLDGSVLGSAGDSPVNQFGLQSSHDLGSDLLLDLMLFHVDSLPAQRVRRYTSFNARLAWQPLEQLEVFMIGTNLLDARHFEFGNDPFAGTQAAAVPRGIFAGITYRF